MSKTSLLPKIWQLLILSFAVTSAGVFAQTPNLRNDLQKSFGVFDVVRLDSGAVQDANGVNRSLSFTAAGRDFRLELAVRDLRSPRYRAEETTANGVRPAQMPAAATYKGTIAGEAGSTVRLTLDGTNTEGFFVSGGERFYIESARNYSKNAAADEFIVYRGKDYLGETGVSCRTEIAEKIERGKQAVLENAANMSVPKVIELATDADYDFVASTGGTSASANNKVLSILNMVEGVYQQQLTLTISVVFQHTWTSAPAPYDASGEVAMLASFQAHWNSVYPKDQYPRDAAHLFSYAPNIRTKGYAYIGEICKAITPTHPADAAYGLSGRVPVEWGWEAANFLVTAHEIAHNLGALHNDTSSCTNTLMNTGLNGDTQLTFCQTSRAQIFSYLSVNGGCLSPAAAPAKYDFDADGKADVGVFRSSNGTWYINLSAGGFNFLSFGQAGDKPVAADYDGDGKTDFAVFRGGSWYVMRSATNTFFGAAFGLASDTPAPADFDGDGKTDVAVFRSSNGGWFWLNSANGGLGATSFGTIGDVPVPADYDGDGRADVNLFRPSTGSWYRLNSANGAFFAAQFGANGDRPLIGDFDGDAKSDIAVWRPSDGGWYVLKSANGAFFGQAFGLPTDIPTPADFDGDGKTDVSVYRPSNGYWYRFNSGNGAFAAVPFGISTDVPAQVY